MPSYFIVSFEILIVQVYGTVVCCGIHCPDKKGYFSIHAKVEQWETIHIYTWNKNICKLISY